MGDAAALLEYDDEHAVIQYSAGCVELLPDRGNQFVDEFCVSINKLHLHVPTCEIFVFLRGKLLYAVSLDQPDQSKNQ